MDITGLPNSKYNTRGDISPLPEICMLVFKLFCKWVGYMMIGPKDWYLWVPSSSFSDACRQKYERQGKYCCYAHAQTTIWIYYSDPACLEDYEIFHRIIQQSLLNFLQKFIDIANCLLNTFVLHIEKNEKKNKFSSINSRFGVNDSGHTSRRSRINIIKQSS